MAVRAKAWFCVRWLGGIVGSNATSDMDVLSFVVVVFCEAGASAMERSLIQRRSTECGVFDCHF